MSLILPEIGLLRTIEGLLKWIKYEYEDRFNEGAEEKSYLFRLFGDVKYNGFDYYEQAKKIFIKNEFDQRKVGVRIFFDQSRAHMPTIHIVMPGESNEASGLGYNDNGEFLERQYSSRYALVLTSDNYAEVLILYYAIRSLIMSGFMMLEEFGIRNISIGGGDLQLQPDMVPTNIFYRTVFIDMFYDERIPNMEYDPDDMIRSIYINGRLIEGGGDIPPIPPPPAPYIKLKHNELDEESRKLLGQHPGIAISLDTTDFNGNLNSDITDVQKLAKAVDNLIGGGMIVVDSEFSLVSKNPIENKKITQKFLEYDWKAIDW